MSDFPKHFNYHAHEGNSALHADQHGWSPISVFADGRVDLTVKVQNRAPLSGSCFECALFFLDGAGGVVQRHDVSQLCVGGARVPLSDPSSRKKQVSFQLPSEAVREVRRMAVVFAPGGADPSEGLQSVPEREEGVFDLAFS